MPHERLVQEAALLAERSDIGEELDRLGVPLAHLSDLVEAEGSLGKRLDFLSQEILRELNTAGSKCRDPQVVGREVAVAGRDGAGVDEHDPAQQVAEQREAELARGVQDALRAAPRAGSERGVGAAFSSSAGRACGSLHQRKRQSPRPD